MSRPVWDGTAFVWSYLTMEGGGEIRGTLSPDGLTILSLTARETERIEINANDPNATRGTHTWRVEARNVRMTRWNQERDTRQTTQAAYEAVKEDVGGAVIKVEDMELVTYSMDPRGSKGPIDHRTSLVAPNWSVGGGITVHFEKRTAGLKDPPY
jgi:hypothetical protein